ncbi:NUDIX domain-containing protein [Paludibacterium yongneupense]|uniref:NUDIX domain-containing protein n=1 Tax=Paludibacterium yongneupense TaxID=400061 RepID=UPI0004114465|nr:NUDIX hydrolase [Paludibacterium yongneupense]
MSQPEIETLSSRIVYENRWMKVREDRIRRRSGAIGLYGVVEKPDFVAIAALHEGGLMMVEQYRYPVGARSLELPQGSWEDQADVDHAVLAAAELREETGFAAASLVYAGHLHLGCAFSNQRYHIYLASGLTHVGSDPDPEEEGLEAKCIGLDQVEAMITAGEITDATTVAVLGLLRLKGLLPR